MVHAASDARGRARAGRQGAPLRDPGRDTAVDPRPRRHRAGRPDDPRGRRPADRRCTTAPTTTPRSAASPPSSSPSTTRSPTTPSWSCRPPRPAPASGSPTGPPTCCRSATATTCTPPGRTTTGWSAGRCERGFYQGWDLHPAQLPTRYAATYALLPRRARRARSRGSRDYVEQRAGRDRRRAGDRARAGRLRAARARLRGRRRRRGHGRAAAWSDADLRRLGAPLTRLGSRPWESCSAPTSTARPRTGSSASSATPPGTRSAT